MRYHALACDYDGTLAHHGRVADETVAALQRLADSGRQLILVTGREVDDLLEAFPQVELFRLVVAENGALLYRPADQTATPLAERPPDRFATTLRDRGVDPLSVGQVIVATWHPNETTVLEVIRELGLELEIIFNKGAVMVLPSGVNKASGLTAGLLELRLSPHNAVGVGDAENDHAFLRMCECAVAVANALPALKERCDEVTSSPHGAGVVELIDRLLADDLAGLRPRLARHDLLLGEREDGKEVRLAPQGTNVLVTGPSSSGKTDLVTGLLERLVKRAYQVLVIDPEGDYQTFPDVIHLGTADRAPTVAEALDALDDPARSVVVNLLASKLEDRPPFLQEEEPAAAIRDFSNVIGVPAPDGGRLRPEDDQALAWWRQDGAEPVVFRYAPGTVERRRHIRKYAQGNLGEDKSFHFRGPDQALNLRAHNLMLFLQLGEGVDDATWLHHLRQGDYARWFRDAIKDEALAAEAEEIQRRHRDDPAQSRARLREAVERRYTAPD
jgi:HAD superfamily hydrolase (TIGR01484 family)